MLRVASVYLASLFLAVPAWAGEFNKKISVGDPGPTFNNLLGVDGKKYSTSDFKDKEFLLIAITCNECPVSQSYEHRLIEFAKKYGNRAAVVGINVNEGDDESLAKMKERAKNEGFNFVYLRDESQRIGRALGASVTPQFFLMNKARKIVYTGAFDDHIDERKVKEKYLESAMDSLLKGEKPAKAETRPEGCSVIYPKIGEVRLQVVKFEGVEAAVKAAKGKVAVVDIWATWCIPCKKEFPGLVVLHRKHGGKHLACMSMSIDNADDKDKALKFLKSQDADLANFLVDEEGSKWKDRWNIGGIPIVLVFDKEGKLARRFDNSDPDHQFTYEDVTKFVEGLLAGKP